MSTPLPLLQRGALINRPKEAWLAWDIQDVLSGSTEIDLDDRFLRAEQSWQRPIELSWLLDAIVRNLEIDFSSPEWLRCVQPFLDRIKDPDKHGYSTGQIEQLRRMLEGLAYPFS